MRQCRILWKLSGDSSSSYCQTVSFIRFAVVSVQDGQRNVGNNDFKTYTKWNEDTNPTSVSDFLHSHGHASSIEPKVCLHASTFCKVRSTINAVKCKLGQQSVIRVRFIINKENSMGSTLTNSSILRNSHSVQHRQQINSRLTKRYFCFSFLTVMLLHLSFFFNDSYPWHTIFSEPICMHQHQNLSWGVLWYEN